MKGLIFDIKELALHDGCGIRTTVFFKGCPLRCVWCHNPEGLSSEPELYIKHNGCLDCGLCRRACSHSDCQGLGRCLHICPKDLISLAGQYVEADALVERLLRDEDIYRASGGGVTLSGGEPLMQSEFAAELLTGLSGRVHRAIETSGFASEDVFRKIIALSDFVYMDIKLADGEEHKRFTGVPNGSILRNAEILKASGVPHCFRTPLIPNITDGESNLAAIAEIVGDSPWERLPYNSLAPAKYASVGRSYEADKYIKA